jgi:flagellar protein FliS
MMMMMMTSPALNNNSYTQHYAEEQIKTASKEQLLLMLFDGAIRFLRVGKKAMLAKDYEKSNHNLIKAQKIVTEFIVSLDVKLGGETAENLLKLYEFYYHSLVKANLQKDTALLEEITQELVKMRKMWSEAVQIAATERKLSNQGSSSQQQAVTSANERAVIRKA